MVHILTTAPGRWLRLSVLGLALLLPIGCSSDEETTVIAQADPQSLFDRGMGAMEAGEYGDAAELFDEVERQHPYSSLAPQAQLMAAYAKYLENRYDAAIGALQRYIELHPGAEDVPYAYYLIALCYYEQISDVGRDQKMTRYALASLEEVMQRFPDSRFARDAKLKRDLALDHLAGKEMEVGRYYLVRGEYLPAINRFRVVVKDYQTTSQVPEALHRLVESYLALGITSEAQATGAVLGHNFPGSEWYQDTYALLTGQDLRPEQQEGSWIDSIWPF